MNALVTGAGGFIGSHLARELINRGYSVKGLFMPTEESSDAEALGIGILKGDITVPSSLQGVAEGVDTVFHLATRTSDWGSKKEFERIMIGGTLNILEASRGKISRFIYFSSIAALGFGRDLVGIKEDAKRIPCGIPYCDTKIKAEDLVKDFCTRNNIGYTIIRPANVIGPGSVWVRDILDAYNRTLVPLMNGGKAPGAFVYVDNLVDGSILAAESSVAKSQTYHFRDDYDITWGDYFRHLGDLINKKPAGSIPFKLAWGLGHMMETLLTPLNIRPPMTRLAAGVLGKNLDVDTSKAKEDLNWESRVTLNDAIERITEWVHEVYLSENRSDTQ